MLESEHYSAKFNRSMVHFPTQEQYGFLRSSIEAGTVSALEALSLYKRARRCGSVWY